MGIYFNSIILRVSLKRPAVNRSKYTPLDMPFAFQVTAKLT